MNREYTPPQLLALPPAASLSHRHSRVSQICPLPTVKEANRSGTVFTIRTPAFMSFCSVRIMFDCSHSSDQVRSKTE